MLPPLTRRGMVRPKTLKSLKILRYTASECAAIADSLLQRGPT